MSTNPHSHELADYESDFFLWTRDMAAKLRNRDAKALDWDNIAEEIESLGRRDRIQLRSRLEKLIMHLLKWAFQPEHRSTSWRSTIREQRRRISLLLEESPSLRPMLPDLIARSWPYALKEAVEEMGLLQNPFPTDCPMTVDQLLDDAYFPDQLPAGGVDDRPRIRRIRAKADL